MRQRATVESLDGSYAVVSVRRESACSGDCHKCAGCGAVTQTLQVRAENLISAGKGDVVYIESCSAVVLRAVVLVYLLPLVTFLLGYFLGSLWGKVGLTAILGFLLGWIPALCYNRHVRACPPVYRIVAYVEQ
ncbi:MAG: SoxR reducing system RseC family protein [Oscillospiraceae bacterium]|nr:SoxR reducing system RseC family protein [Oscillospiraceae bacterium]